MNVPIGGTRAITGSASKFAAKIVKTSLENEAILIVGMKYHFRD